MNGILRKLLLELEERGFRHVEKGYEAFMIEMPNGHRDHQEAVEYLEDLTLNYSVVAFKNFSFFAGENNDRITGIIEVLAGSLTRELVPVINIRAWHGERQYMYRILSERFLKRLRTFSNDDMGIDGFFEDMADIVSFLQRNVREWILTGKWPEEDNDTKTKED
jgi:hypothetical protein